MRTVTATTYRARRIAAEPYSTVAVWTGPGIGFTLYCLEPGPQRIPHPGIPAGTYTLRLRTEGEKHAQYKAYYDTHANFGPAWHKGMIEIVVPGRIAIEVHIGNFISDTEGCSVTGDFYGLGPDGHYRVANSRASYEEAYPVFRDSIEAGLVQVQITDIEDGAMT